MNAEKIFKIIPDHILDQIALETGADNFVKKLKGAIVFKLFKTSANRHILRICRH